MQLPVQPMRMMIMIGLLAYSSAASAAAQAKLDYDLLDKKCEQEDSPNCCKSSVNTMRTHGYFLEPTVGCPSGYRRNMLRCLSTLHWCEPVDEKSAQKAEH
jgi:hypothetical protein